MALTDETDKALALATLLGPAVRLVGAALGIPDADVVADTIGDLPVQKVAAALGPLFTTEVELAGDTLQVDADLFIVMDGEVTELPPGTTAEAAAAILGFAPDRGHDTFIVMDGKVT